MSDLPQNLIDMNTWLTIGSSSPVPSSNDVVDRQNASSSDQQRVEAEAVISVRKRGRPRKTAIAAAQTAARHTNTPAERGPGASLGAIDNEWDALSEDEDEHQRTDRPFDELERRRVQAERFRKRTKASTAQQYAPTIKAYLAWCQENNIMPEVVSLGDVHKLGRFYDEYCSGKWLPPSGGRNRKGEGLQGNAAMNVHSALVKYVGECCSEAGATPLNPTQDSSYHSYYKQYTANRGRERACNVVPKPTNQEHVKGLQVGGCAQPDQQQPSGQLPLQRQPSGRQPAQQQQQQQSQQAFRQQQQQQQHTAEAGQHQPQPEQHWRQQGMLMTVQLLQRQIQLRQAELDAMPPGPRRVSTTVIIQGMLQQLLQLQQALVLQPGQHIPAPSSTSAAAAAAAAAAAGKVGSSCMTGQDPADACMEPVTRSNPDLSSAVGTSLSGTQGCSCSCSAAAELVGCEDVLQERLREIVQQAVEKALPVALQQAGLATAGAASGTGSPAAEAAAADHSTSSGAPTQQAGTGCPLQREVPFLRGQKSLPDMMQWYTQERDIAVEEGGGVKMYTRAELRDQGKSWASRDSSRRAAEYDVIYDRLKAVVVQLTKETNQPRTMDDAVQHVVQTAKVCQPGGISIYKYMQQCRDWRKARQQAKAATGAEQGCVGT